MLDLYKLPQPSRAASRTFDHTGPDQASIGERDRRDEPDRFEERSRTAVPNERLLAGSPGPARQAELSVVQAYGEVDVTGIIRRTDVGFSGTGYAFSQDPGQIGFFGVAGFARGPTGGDGYPVAPLLFQFWGHALQTLGAWRLASSAGYGRYVDGEGSSATVSLKVAYSASARIRLWATGTLQRDERHVDGHRRHGRDRNRVAVDLLTVGEKRCAVPEKRSPALASRRFDGAQTTKGVSSAFGGAKTTPTEKGSP